MSDDRLTLALGIDVARQFDSTVTEAQINQSTFQSSGDDEDLLSSMIEDAEREFYDAVDTQLEIGRAGVEGKRETFEQPTYKISGHKITKGNFTGVWSDYNQSEANIVLENTRVLPFDSAEGDAVYVYQGLQGSTGSSAWKDITDQEDDQWAILDNREGIFAFDPDQIWRTIRNRNSGLTSGPSSQRRVRFAITYRYGGLGGSRSTTSRTQLGVSLDDTQTDTVDVADGSAFPTSGGSGSIVVLVGREYMSVDPDPTNDQMTIVERGVRGTTATSHASGDRIQYTPPSVRKAVAARAGMQLVNAGRYSEFLPDTDDSLDKSDMLDQMELTWNSTIEVMS